MNIINLEVMCLCVRVFVGSSHVETVKVPKEDVHRFITTYDYFYEDKRLNSCRAVTRRNSVIIKKSRSTTTIPTRYS